jgi:hypothetical protein
MRRFSILLFFAFITFHASGQAYFTYGYGSNFTSANGLNQFVKNYNDTRPWLDKDLKKFSYVDGFAVSFGAGLGTMWVDMQYGFRGQKRSANGTGTSGVHAIRDVKLKQAVFAFSSGVILVEDKGGVSFGVRGEFGKQKVLTRVYESSSEKPEWDKYDLGLIANLGPVMKIFIAPDAGAVGSLSIYYTFGIIKTNAYEVEEAINNSTPDYKDKKFQNDNGVFGFCLSFGVFGG